MHHSIMFYYIILYFTLISLSLQQNAAKPILNSFQGTHNQRQGSRFVLTCAASFGQAPIEFTWKKNGNFIANQQDYQIDTNDMISFLLIKNVSRHHSGNYTCNAANAYGYDSQSTYLNVQCVFWELCFQLKLIW